MSGLDAVRTKATLPVLALASLALAATGCGSAKSASSSAKSTPTASAQSASVLAPVKGTYKVSIGPANFVTAIDNRYFPLKPGTAYHYEGVRGTTKQTDDMVVTHQVKRILGVACTVVRDTVSEKGHAVERTYDWYAQDRQGNVWYMGEDAFELQHGHMAKASDSWESGVHGGQPRIIMPGDPRSGDRYRQEYYPPGNALDEAHVLGKADVKVPYGAYKGALRTSEFSPLEPQTEEKYYVAGLGEVAERVVKGHHEEFQLVRFTG